MLNKFVVIDLETTGNLPKKGDRIIQFAAVVIEKGKITKKYSSFLHPQKKIPLFIEELTGINNEMVENAPLFSEIAHEVVSLLENAYFVAHNVLFDLSFLQEELIHAGHEGFYGPVLDTVELARILYPTADGYKLTDLADKENLNHDRPHQADSDAFVTAELFLRFYDKLLSLPINTFGQLSKLSGGLKSDIHQLLDEILIEKDKRLEGLPDQLESYNGLILKRIPPVLHKENETENNPFPENNREKEVVFQKAIPSYKKRDGQFQMMDHIYQSFLDKKHVVIEAGTGIGKSLGYLYPAVFIAQKKKTPIVVSTHTIQLQEQLLKKEIPQLQKAVPFHVKSVILKGKNHYINLKKFAYALENENDNYDTTLTKMQILIWLLETETGDCDELNLSSGGMLFWNKIKNDYFDGLNNGEWLEKDYYLRARKAAEDADIIITNHSLLLADLINKQNILPQHDYVILDEGHHFGKAASKFFGKSLDYLSIRLLLSRLGRYEDQQLFYKMEKQLGQIEGNKEGIIHTVELNQLLADLFYETDEFFKRIVFFAKRRNKDHKGINRLRIKLTGNEKEATPVFLSAERCIFFLKDICGQIEKRLFLLKTNEKTFTTDQMSQYEKLISCLNDLSMLKKDFQEVILGNSSQIRWIEMDLRSTQNATTIYVQPISISQCLGEQFFNRKKGVVITSATLTVNQSYDFILKELGLDLKRTNVVTIPSPFDYRKQVRMLIPKDLPEITDVSVDEYVISITEQIISIAEATMGRMLILFTSNEMLQKTYDLIKESGFLSEFSILAHGITSGSKYRLTKYFQKYEKAILLGSSSFWEGIDIPGSDLSCLIMVRLPFSPPDEPYTEAKCNFITQKGGNAFTEFTLPEAVLRFKQGFGRLIRTETDRGILIVFDKRIVSTKYGRTFLQSIPEVQIQCEPINEIVPFIKDWL